MVRLEETHLNFNFQTITILGVYLDGANTRCKIHYGKSLTKVAWSNDVLKNNNKQKEEKKHAPNKEFNKKSDEQTNISVKAKANAMQLSAKVDPREFARPQMRPIFPSNKNIIAF